MSGWSKLVSMERSDDEKFDAMSSYPSVRPDYPPGLMICFTEVELEKLGLSIPENGDMLDLRAFATVTSVSEMTDGGGKRTRVEMTIEKIAVENEMTEKD